MENFEKMIDDSIICMYAIANGLPFTRSSYSDYEYKVLRCKAMEYHLNQLKEINIRKNKILFGNNE